MIEDESDSWTVSRYIHLNPVRAGLVARPEDWEWSSYPGYLAAGRRRPWVPPPLRIRLAPSATLR
jgi:putative transposase